jgi:hypothetical protein
MDRGQSPNPNSLAEYVDAVEAFVELGSALKRAAPHYLRDERHTPSSYATPPRGPAQTADWNITAAWLHHSPPSFSGVHFLWPKQINESIIQYMCILPSLYAFD